MQTVALIDYGSGNLRSAEKALQAAANAGGGETCVLVTDAPEAVAAADRVVLPGVGAFAACMAALHARPGLVEAMTQAVQRRGAPFLGVCVGMQLLATRGLEFGDHAGLDWIAGEVRRLDPVAPDLNLKVPHVGWNDVEPTGRAWPGPLTSTPMYFTHSYAFTPRDPSVVAATTDHGGAFASAVVWGNVAGVQFHPEKSQAGGLDLIARFLAWRP